MVSEIGEKLRSQVCAYPDRDCEICPHKDKQLREEGKINRGRTNKGLR